MRIIAHRGNLTGPRPAEENHPEYVTQALDSELDAEVDVWHHRGAWWLGHDSPQYPIREEWLWQANLWVHCKNAAALTQLALKNETVSPNLRINFFWHQGDDHTLTARGFVWSLGGTQVGERSVVVDLAGESSYHESGPLPYAVCTDYPLRLRATSFHLC